MANFRIFTEGKGDIKFLVDYVSEIFGLSLSEKEFDVLGSWSGYKAGGNLINAIKQNHDNEKVTILILDANSNINKRREEITKDFESYKIPVHLFLFPDNSSNGNRESLLSEIAVDRKIMDCFLEYEKCVTGHPKPLNDARIYSYMDMLLYPTPKDEKGNDLRKEEFCNYRNHAHWNLNHTNLEPLKKFLTPFVK
jgi:hypothetical protein